MTLNTFFTAIAAFGTVVAGVALLLTYRQFQKLDKNVKGNTYQLLADQILEILKLLLEYLDLKYLDLINPEATLADRQQAIFDRLLTDCVDNIWGQIKLGLMDKELESSFLSLIDQIVTSHPEVARTLMRPNFTGACSGTSMGSRILQHRAKRQ